MKADVYNLKNEVVGTVELPATVFGTKWNATLVQQVLEAQLANARQPWAHVMDRSEVRGGGKKPWRQKGTGRARHGSTRSPIWVGGGKAHGPRNDKDYSQKVNKKMKRVALFSVLSKKIKDGEVKIFDTLVVETPKTKTVASALKMVLSPKKGDKRFDVLLVSDNANKNLVPRDEQPPENKDDRGRLAQYLRHHEPQEPLYRQERRRKRSKSITRYNTAMTDHLLIKKPWITEKATMLTTSNQYVFMVKSAATKPEVKKAIHALYKVDVVGVNMVNRAGKMKKSGRGIKGRPRRISQGDRHY